jgi:hypothetical protein
MIIRILLTIAIKIHDVKEDGVTAVCQSMVDATKRLSNQLLIVY